MKQIAIITIIVAMVLNYSWIKEINQTINYLSRRNSYHSFEISLIYSMTQNSMRSILKALCTEYDSKTVVLKSDRPSVYGGVASIYFGCGDKKNPNKVFSLEEVIIGNK